MSPEEIWTAFVVAWSIATGAWFVWYALDWARRSS